MKFRLTKKNALIAFAVFSLVSLTIVIIILLKPGKRPDGCGSGFLCKKPGTWFKQCLPKDFCSNSGLADNNTDCNCKADCPTGQESFPATVEMKKDPIDNTKWIPDGTIPVCGISCTQATTPSPTKVPGANQGKGYCLPDPSQYCGVGNIHAKYQQSDVYTGCFPTLTWTKCSNSYCPIPKKGSSSNACTTDGYCVTDDYCGKTNQSNNPKGTNLYQACQGDGDCKDMYGQQGVCYTKDPNLTNKNIKNVGYCQPDPSKPGQKLFFQPPSGNTHCTTLDKIGNDKQKNLVVCTGTKTTDPLYGVGVDGSIQCKNSDAAKGCAPYGICSTNYWQAYFDKNKDLLSCLVGPPKTYDSTKTPLCCSSDRIIPSPKGNWCCPVTDTTDCSNTTIHPYSANMLNIPGKSYADSLDCTTDKQCTDQYNHYLMDSLKVDGFKPSSTPGDANFATLFCDTSNDPTTHQPINKCKAKCGYVDSPKHKDSAYAVSNDATTDISKPISFCTPKNQNCQLLPAQDWGDIPPPVNNIPICYDSNNPPRQGSINKFYWSGSDNHTTTYQTQFSRAMSGNNCNTPNMCAKLGSDIKGVYSIEPVTTKTEKSCKFTLNCNKNLTMQPSGMGKMSWSDGLTNLDDTYWQNCNDGTICPKNTGCPCNTDAMWKPIAQSVDALGNYTPDPTTKTCSGITNNIPKTLTVPLQLYVPSTGKCHDYIQREPKIHLNTTGEYCPNGIVPGTNKCYQPQPPPIKNNS